MPTLAQLGWPAAEGLAYALLTGGVAALAAALATGDARLIGAAGVILAAGAVCFAAGIASVLHHMAPCGRQSVVAAGTRTT